MKEQRQEYVFIFYNKIDKTYSAYGSLSALFQDEKDNIRRKIRTLRKIDFSLENYEDAKCIIRKLQIIRKKQQDIFL